MVITYVLILHAVKTLDESHSHSHCLPVICKVAQSVKLVLTQRLYKYRGSWRRRREVRGDSDAVLRVWVRVRGRGVQEVWLCCLLQQAVPGERLAQSQGTLPASSSQAHLNPGQGGNRRDGH